MFDEKKEVCVKGEVDTNINNIHAIIVVVRKIFGLISLARGQHERVHTHRNEPR